MPGRSVPMSFRPRSRLIEESRRSPNWPDTLTSAPSSTSRPGVSTGVPAKTAWPIT